MISLLLSLALRAHAADDLVKVTSIVQFVEGRAVKTESSGQKTDLVYQTPLYEGDRVESAGVLKLSTRTGCIIVLRGEAALAAPVGLRAWRMRAPSVRLICSGRDTPEIFGIDSHGLQIANGEVLFSPRGVLLLRGSAVYLGKTLELHKLYARDGSLLEQPSEAELRQLNLSEKPPGEAYEWPLPPKADKVYHTRLQLGPLGGRTGVSYDNGDYSQSGLKDDGGRFQLHFRRASGAATLFAFTFGETSSDNNDSGPVDGVSNNLDKVILEVGHRNSYDRWWSPYWRVGGGVIQDKIFDNKSNGSGFYNSTAFKYEFYVLSAAYGIDAHLTPHVLRPFGFFAALEAQVYQSVARGARANEQPGNTSTTAQPPEPWRMTAIGALLNVGLEAQL